MATPPPLHRSQLKDYHKGGEAQLNEKFPKISAFPWFLKRKNLVFPLHGMWEEKLAG
jgi:hypothetical protein